MTLSEAILAVCLVLTPARFRADRKEQWRADLLDGPGMGIPPSTILLGAACSAAASRSYELRRRGGIMLSRINKGENMKLAVGALGATAVLAAVVAGGIQVNADNRPYDGAQLQAAMADVGIAGYEGWWNSTHIDGTPAGPPEIVAVNTNTGTIVDYFNRSKAAAGQQLSAADATYDVVPDPTWPASSVVIIDTATGKTIDTFPVDEKGRVIYTHDDGTTVVGY